MGQVWIGQASLGQAGLYKGLGQVRLGQVRKEMMLGKVMLAKVWSGQVKLGKVSIEDLIEEKCQKIQQYIPHTGKVIEIQNFEFRVFGQKKFWDCRKDGFGKTGSGKTGLVVVPDPNRQVRGRTREILDGNGANFDFDFLLRKLKMVRISRIG